MTDRLTTPDAIYVQNSEYEYSRSGFSRYRCAKFDQAGKFLAKRRITQNCWKWIVINVIFAVLFYNGILQMSLKSYGFQISACAINLEYFLSLLFLWNSMVNFYIYLSPIFYRESIDLSPAQQRLLKIFENDKSFNVQDKKNEEIVTPKRVKETITTWPKQRSSSTPNRNALKESAPDLETTPFSSAHDASFSPSRKNMNKSFETPSSATAIMKANTSSSNLSNLGISPGCSPGQREEQIKNVGSLSRYLKTKEEKDAIARRAQLDANRTTMQSFWNYGHSALDFLPNFGIYQLATRSPQSPNQGNDDSPSSFDFELIWKKLNIGRTDLDRWTENIRKWIAETILEKVVAEIKAINDILTQNGCAELTIGSVSVNILRNVATTKSQLAPTLPSVIPYLDVTSNQEYLIKRLQELVTGGCLRLYKSSSGGMYKGKVWDQELPTDAQIVAHLFCTYMDTHLPSNPRYQQGFTGLHFLKPPCKQSDRKCDISILQTRSHPPHFRVIDAEESYDTPPGRHNLFTAISIFLYLIKTKKHGMLERVNLGPSGINILWILNKRG